jgi:hypothetical protein
MMNGGGAKVARRSRVLALTAFVMWAWTVSALAAPADSIYPEGGKWTGLTKHDSQKVSFKVDAQGKHASDFVLHVPYTCASGTPPGVITFHHPRRAKINAYNGYFYISDSNLSIPGFSNDINLQFDGFFSSHGVRSTKAKGGIGTDFTTVNGDECNDRFDSWKGSK